MRQSLVFLRQRHGDSGGRGAALEFVFSFSAIGLSLNRCTVGGEPYQD